MGVFVLTVFLFKGSLQISHNGMSAKGLSNVAHFTLIGCCRKIYLGFVQDASRQEVSNMFEPASLGSFQLKLKISPPWTWQLGRIIPVNKYLRPAPFFVGHL